MAVVPQNATTGPVAVTNANGTATSPKPFTVLTTPKILGIDPNRLGQGTTNITIITGVNLAGATEVTFNSSGLTASILPGATSDKLRISLAVAPFTTPGSYAFSVTTPTGLTQSGTITVTVLPVVAAFSATREGVSVFLPPSPDPVSPSGPAASFDPRTECFSSPLARPSLAVRKQHKHRAAGECINALRVCILIRTERSGL